jgi:hypothetical protein
MGMEGDALRRERLAEWVAMWTGEQPLTADERTDVVERLLEVSSSWPDEVVDPWLERCLGGDEIWWGKMVTHALCLAGDGGASPVAWLGPDVLLMDVGGQEVAMGFDPQTLHARDAVAIERVEEALDRSFGMEEYVLHIRKVPDADVNLEPMVQAVRLWVATPFDGDLCSAVYDDGDVAIHLRRTGVFVAEGVGARQMTVPEMRGWNEVAAMRARVQALDVEGRPLIWVCGRARGATWPPGLMRQILYGCPVEMEASSEGVNARFQRDAASLFGGPSGVRVLSIWWLGGEGSDPLTFTPWIHDNPWVDTSEVSLNSPDASPGTDRSPSGAKDERRVAWTVPGPTVWRGQP